MSCSATKPPTLTRGVHLIKSAVTASRLWFASMNSIAISWLGGYIFDASSLVIASKGGAFNPIFSKFFCHRLAVAALRSFGMGVNASTVVSCACQIAAACSMIEVVRPIQHPNSTSFPFRLASVYKKAASPLRYKPGIRKDRSTAFLISSAGTLIAAPPPCVPVCVYGIRSWLPTCGGCSTVLSSVRCAPGTGGSP